MEIKQDVYKSEEYKLKRLQSVLQAVAFSVVPVFLFYLMEFYEHTPWKEVRPKAQIFNVFLFELIAWLLFLLIKRAGIALQLVAVVSMLFGLINHYVMKFRSTPFVPWDIYSVKTAASVAENYDFTPEVRVIVVTAIFLAIIIGCCFWKYRIELKIAVQIVAVLLVFGALLEFAYTLQQEEFQNRNYLYPFLFTPTYMTKVNGMAVTFTMDLAYLAVDKPGGYHKNEMKHFLQEHNQKTDVENEKELSDLPNIIVVMDEAFSDLSVLGKFAVNEDYMPFVHQLQQGYDNTITGNLQVSVCGGNTANSEFEFLTGNTMAFLPIGSIPYQQYVKKETPSLASYLKTLGYVTFAQHPYYASGWEREKVYPRLGFDKLTFIDEYSNPKYIRKYVSDRSSFDKIIQTYKEKEEGVPAFIFNVTMQNHGGYTEEYYNLESDIHALGIENEALDQYLSLIKITDLELERMIRFFEKEEEKTVVVFFGDHQPSDAVAGAVLAANGKNVKNLTEEEQVLRYQVPYIIWANFDINEEKNADTSVNYLAANVLYAAGVPTSDYQNFLLELEQKYPLISASKKLDLEEDAIKDYRKLQYYRLFDWEGEDN